MKGTRCSNGCWTCRLRKKKCPEERPGCSTCKLLRITCHGYGEKPAWMDGGPRERAETEYIKMGVKENKKCKKKTRSSTRLPKNLHFLPGDSIEPRSSHSIQRNNSTTDISISGSYQDESHLLQSSINEVTLRQFSTTKERLPYLDRTYPADLHRESIKLSGEIYGREANLLMHYLDNVFRLQFRFYSPLVSEGGRGWLLGILLRTKPLYHAALSLSAYHQRSMLTLHSNIRDNQNVLADLEEHHSLSLTGLRQHINSLSLESGKRQMAVSVEILACMIQLISFEAFRGENNDWQTHLEAARALFVGIKYWITIPLHELGFTDASQNPIQHYGRENETANVISLSYDEILALDFFASALVWFDILSSITTGLKPSYPEVFSSLLSIEEGRIQLCQLMGCKNWVMALIMDIAILDDWKSEGQRRGNLSLPEVARRAAAIEIRLKTGILKNKLWPMDPETDVCGVRTVESQYVTQIFAYATQVYLHVVQSGAYPEIIEIRESVMETLKAFQNLPDPRWVRHLVWPFCVAGCMAGEEYEDDFRRLAATAKMNGEAFGNLEKASAIMEECWRGRRRQRTDAWSWKTAMAGLGINVLLI